ncbi:MAG: cupin domain-containing protein [Bacteroidales bacterium]|nr:cupin domain-containing protein [Bacteroidales bacterium]MBN2819849.1 cupin domain-containing protein [Bacteroidales bacterium]
MEKVIINEKLALFSEHWKPKIVGELNEQYVKLAKIKGEFVWHKHEKEDEMFYVLSGELKIELRDKVLTLNPNEFAIIPKGVEHRPVAIDEVSIMIIEPMSTLNTGDAESELTVKELDRI